MKLRILTAMIATSLASSLAVGSSHREAPLVTETPKVDATDLYMFRSYAPGREAFVTLIANYQPGQAPHDGPNYFFLDPEAVYQIHIDNNADAKEDISFQFRIQNRFQNKTLPVGDMQIAVPLLQIGSVTGTAPNSNDEVKNLIETYTLNVVNGDVQGSMDNRFGARNAFRKPLDNIGTKTLPNYTAYANNHIFPINLPNCATQGRVFVGQRKESFRIALGKVFDLLNLNPLGSREGNQNPIELNSVSTFALELPISCITAGSEPIIGAWTTASLQASNGDGSPTAGSAFSQRSRLGMPLVNEIVIGLPDKDKFNASKPQDDAQFAKYVTNPTFPELVEILFPNAPAPNLFPRTDLVSVYLTGVEGLNKPANVVPSEMLRLNTSIAPRAVSAQNDLGVLGNDTAGFPNGRRPGDDIVDITLRVAQGALLTADVAPARDAPLTDGVAGGASRYLTVFPYLNTPLPGSNDAPVPAPDAPPSGKF